ncbi:MAG: hypothetical protein WBC33_07880 [Conexibacter sp.]
MRKLMRKRVLIPVAAVMALAIAGVAVAYFTSSGTGSGTASVGTDAGVTISPVTVNATLYPGGSSSVDFTVNNTSADTSAKVDKVVADTAAGTNGITGLPAGCDAADFHFGDVTVNADIAASGSASASGTLSMDNTSANQDACKGASLTLHLKVDNSGI